MARTIFGREELVAGRIERQGDVHEAARGENADADEADIARVKRFISSGTSGISRSCGKPGPGQHVADLLGVVALHLAEILRQDVDRAEQREAEQHVDEHADRRNCAASAGAD